MIGNCGFSGVYSCRKRLKLFSPKKWRRYQYAVKVCEISTEPIRAEENDRTQQDAQASNYLESVNYELMILRRLHKWQYTVKLIETFQVDRSNFLGNEVRTAMERLEASSVKSELHIHRKSKM